VRRTNRANISSAALPKVTLSKPPTEGPARLASWSMARRIHSASGTMARTALRKIHSGGAWKT
jgi:hypothetical protein